MRRFLGAFAQIFKVRYEVCPNLKRVVHWQLKPEFQSRYEGFGCGYGKFSVVWPIFEALHEGFVGDLARF